MSITFWYPEAPTKRIPCRYCADPEAPFPHGNGLGGKCDFHCNGFEEVSEAPEVNLSNMNARGILSLLGWDVQGDIWGGSCSGAEMRQRILKARNMDRSHLVEEPYEIPGGNVGVKVEHDGNVAHVQHMGAQVVSGGNTDEQTLRRLDSLETLAIYAQEHGFKVSWG